MGFQKLLKKGKFCISMHKASMGGLRNLTLKRREHQCLHMIEKKLPAKFTLKKSILQNLP